MEEEKYIEGVLEKVSDSCYHLYVDDELYVNMNSLSLHNCQAIERGYDLDELADDFIRCPKDMRTLSEDREINSFKKGFKMRDEMLSDKKFTDEDVRKAIHLSRTKNRDEYVHSENKIIQSLQKNKWNVLIDVEWNPVSNNCSSCGSGGNAMSKPCDHPLNCVHWKLKLDENNKIILKIKS